VRPLIPGIGRDQALVVVSLRLGVGVGTGLQPEDHELLAFRSFVGKRRGLLQMLEEILGRGRAQGQTVVRQRKLRVFGWGLSQKLAGVVPPEILGQGPLGAGLQVSLIFWGWMPAQYPLLIPPSFTIVGSAAPDATLRALLIATAFGGIVLVPSLWYLFHIFKTVPADPGVRQP